jgi:predicted RNA methylase
VPSLRNSAATLLDRAREYPLERRYEADFAPVELADVGYHADGRERYAASRFIASARAIRRLGLGAHDSVADLGAGKGLGMMMAAEYPARRVVGVELVPEFAETARANIANNRGRLKAADIEVVTGDVLEWEVPDDLTVVYLYSPFFGDLFAQVLDRLLDSVERHPRPLRVVYAFPREHERMLEVARAEVLDVISFRWPAPRAWWDTPHVIVTYGLGPGAFPRPKGLPARRPAVKAWAEPRPAVDWAP